MVTELPPCFTRINKAIVGAHMPRGAEDVRPNGLVVTRQYVPPRIAQ